MINLTLRIVLIIGSLFTLLYMLFRIRVSKVEIKDSVFWILFALGLLVLSVFPSIASWFSHILRIESPINFILLFIIFILIIQLFFISMKLSKTETNLKVLTQRLSIDDKDGE